MNETQVLELLDVYVAPFDGEPEEWDDVVSRIRRRRLPRRRIALLAAVLAAALAGGPALGVLLLRDDSPRLPAAADKSHAVAALDPRTGRVAAEVAPWKGHDGVCILFTGRSAGCWPRTAKGGLIILAASGEWGFTFDHRATGAVALLLSWRRVPITFVRFPALGVAVFASTEPIRGDVQAVEVLGAHGRVLLPQWLEVPVPSR